MWGRRSAAQRLAESAGFTWKNVGDQSDLSVAKMTAYVAVNRAMADDVLPTVGRVAEKLAAEEANYELVVALVENLQHLVSHGLEHLRTTEEVRAVLGPRCLVVWKAVEEFWARVAEWRRGTGEPLRSSVDILSVENEQLRATLWTSNRSLGDDTRVGTAEALLYEKDGGIEIPSYRELLAP
ncbi:hypothetical protein ABZX92_26200 [Lentzea sp. NPDC006480]|uniref:hypothetical protein n=1 Tax=Lentzea sp. NPDC006480 TaxID=3157176 RepID=UPI0033AD3DA8